MLQRLEANEKALIKPSNKRNKALEIESISDEDNITQHRTKNKKKCNVYPKSSFEEDVELSKEDFQEDQEDLLTLEKIIVRRRILRQEVY